MWGVSRSVIPCGPASMGNQEIKEVATNATQSVFKGALYLRVVYVLS